MPSARIAAYKRSLLPSWPVCPSRLQIRASETYRISITPSTRRCDYIRLSLLVCLASCHRKVPSSMDILCCQAPRSQPKHTVSIDSTIYFQTQRGKCSTPWSLEYLTNQNSFNPERWENPTKEMKDASLPFGGGSRSQLLRPYDYIESSIELTLIVCLGMHLARMELRLATALFFRALPDARISTQEGMTAKDMEMEAFFLMAPRGHRCLIETWYQSSILKPHNCGWSEGLVASMFSESIWRENYKLSSISTSMVILYLSETNREIYHSEDNSAWSSTRTGCG